MYNQACSFTELVHLHAMIDHPKPLKVGPSSSTFTSDIERILSSHIQRKAEAAMQVSTPDHVSSSVTPATSPKNNNARAKVSPEAIKAATEELLLLKKLVADRKQSIDHQAMPHPSSDPPPSAPQPASSSSPRSSSPDPMRSSDNGATSSPGSAEKLRQLQQKQAQLEQLQRQGRSSIGFRLPSGQRIRSLSPLGRPSTEDLMRATLKLETDQQSPPVSAAKMQDLPVQMSEKLSDITDAPEGPNDKTVPLHDVLKSDLYSLSPSATAHDASIPATLPAVEDSTAESRPNRSMISRDISLSPIHDSFPPRVASNISLLDLDNVDFQSLAGDKALVAALEGVNLSEKDVASELLPNPAFASTPVPSVISASSCVTLDCEEKGTANIDRKALVNMEEVKGVEAAAAALDSSSDRFTIVSLMIPYVLSRCQFIAEDVDIFMFMPYIMHYSHHCCHMQCLRSQH